MLKIVILSSCCVHESEELTIKQFWFCDRKWPSLTLLDLPWESTVLASSA